MKRLTLDETWTLCLKMWRWIAKEKRQGSKVSVPTLKHQWLDAHGYDADDEGAPMSVYENCFFCEYIHKGNFGCGSCPGTLIDEKFGCGDDNYHWFSNPIGFYNKLRSLHRIYKRKKK